ncbi:MAG: type IX secretion system membrane protein PorP/SprF [Bacteroidales bacterium]
MKKLLIIILLSQLAFKAGSQHLFPVYSQYMLNGLALNPAYSGSRDVFNITLGYRNQWVGFDGAPVSQTLSAHSPMRNENIALGLFLHNEQIDVRNNTSLYLNYAYRLTIGNGRLAMGLKAGAIMRNADWTSISLHDPGDEVFSDPATQEFLPNFGFGLYYYTNSYFLGASIPFFLSDSTRNARAVSYHDMRNYNYLLSGGLVIGKGGFKVKPSFLVKYKEKNPLQVDANLSFIFSDLIWVGASYRLENTVVGLVKVQLSDQLRIGYTYDYSIGPLSNYNNGSHEIVLIYDFRYRVNAVNPRYF